MQNANVNSTNTSYFDNRKRASFGSFRGSLLHLQQNSDLSQIESDSKGKTASVPFYKLFRYSTWMDFGAIFIGILLAVVMGLCIPLGVVIYGEFTSVLLDRVAFDGVTPPTILLQLFGGGKLIANRSDDEEVRQAILDDSAAFGIGATIITLIQLVVGIGAVDLMNWAAVRQINRVRYLLLESMLRQEISWYDTNSNMNFATKMSDDLEKIKDGTGEKIAIFLYLVSSFVFSVIIAFLYGWKLTLVVLSSSPVIIATTAIVSKIQSDLTTKELSAYSMAGIIAEEVLGSVRTVVAFGGEKKETERYSASLKPAEVTGCRKGLFSGLGSGIMWFIIYVCYAIAFYYGVNLILEDRGKEDKEYTVGVLMIVFFGVLASAQNLGLTSAHVEAFGAARGSASSVYEILDRKSAIDPLCVKGLKPEYLEGQIEFKDVHFQYPSRSTVKILQGLNLTIQPGQIVALVGPSGCGKSTCLQLIQRLYDPIKGAITIDNNDLRNVNVHWLRSNIGVVGQEPVLFATTIRENIRYGKAGCTDEEIEMATKSANCHDFIMKLPMGYNTLVGERGAQLSGGQKQRIAIARALVKNPKILILDEATSALDLQSEAKVQRALDSASKGRTTIIVSHRLSTITNADKIFYVDKGVVVESGTHMELLKLKAHYYNLVRENIPTRDNENSEIAYIDNDGDETEEKDAGNKAVRLSQISMESEESELTISVTSDKKIEVEEVIMPDATTWRIMKLNLPEWHLILIGCICSLALGGTFPAFAILFGEIYWVLSLDDADEVRGRTVIYCIYFLVIGIVTGVGMFLQIYLFNISGARLTSRLRSQTFSTMLQQEMGWFDDNRNSVGALNIRLAGDCSSVQGATGTRVGSILQAASTLLMGVFLSLFFSWKMTLVSMVTVPIVLGTVFLESRVISGDSVKEKMAMESSSKIATEAITNIRTVLSLCQEKGVLERYMIEVKQLFITNKLKSRLRGIVFSLGQSSPYLGYALSLYYGGTLVANKDIEYQDVIKVSECLIFGAWMIGQALAFAPNFNNAMLSATRLFQLFDRVPKILSPTKPIVSDSWIAEGDITYNKVQFHYPTRPEVEVLQGFSLDIYKGKTVALVGHSGCGKSTCIQLIQRLYDPLSGSVSIDDKNIIQDMTLPKLRSQIGIVSQEPVLFDKTMAENIAYGDNTRDVSMDEVIQAAKSANVHGFISALPMGYETKLGTKGVQLSGGQKQRIAIARALIRNPKILLLDEATSALDTHSEKVVQEALDKASEGRTCIVIAHRLATIKNADVICVLDKGQVAESGTHKQLVKMGGLYAQLNSLRNLSLDEDEEE